MQTNKFNLRGPPPQRHDRRDDAGPVQKKPNADILEHNRKREIELEVEVMRAQLEDDGCVWGGWQLCHPGWLCRGLGGVQVDLFSVCDDLREVRPSWLGDIAVSAPRHQPPLSATADKRLPCPCSSGCRLGEEEIEERLAQYRSELEAKAELKAQQAAPEK